MTDEPQDHEERYVLRRMREGDVDGVLAIEEVSYPTPWSRSAFLGELRGGSASYPLVAVDGDGEEETVAGYICTWIVRDLMQINNVAVHPDHRGRGLGRRLLLRTLRTGRQRGVESCFLDVRTSNTIAQSLYRSLGFQEVGLRRGYYADTREDAIVMRLDLEEVEPKH